MMTKNQNSNLPLVSIIITSYNHSKFISEAIDSVRVQTYPRTEIIVVDDGSTDHTKDIVTNYPEIQYKFQQNQGLSAARNTGISLSKGQLLMFLDADDLLINYAVEYNVDYLKKNPEAVFVSGASQVFTHNRKILGEKKETVESDHYIHLLKSNYIGMHGTVMYKKKIFEEFKFDSTLRACEDYDMYLKVARKYPIVHHTENLALYRMHDSNMSKDIPLMLTTALEVLNRQKQFITMEKEHRAYEVGIKNYKVYYTTLLYNQLRIHGKTPPKETLLMLKKNNLKLYYRYLFTQTMVNLVKKSPIKKHVPDYWKFILFKLKFYPTYIPKVGNVKTGHFYRTTPFSKSFGYDRGGPIDRYYIENFLAAEAESIRGRVLEIGDNKYTLQYGSTNVQKSDILHVDQGNPDATIVGDLSYAPHIDDDTFDCIILTQTLHLVYNYKAVIQTCFRILKPGGTLLLTVPGITPIDYGEWGNNWLWSFTGRAVIKILGECFQPEFTEVNSFGNVYVASAFLYGMGLQEIKKVMLDINDPNMQVIITAKAVKPGK